MLDLLDKYKNDGYVIIDCDQKSIIETIEKKFEKLLQSGDYNTNAKIYSYNDKPRIVDAYKKIEEIVEFSRNKILTNFLKKFYNSDPLPFSNILFKFGSEQPLHSDYIHHGTYPELLLCGTWTAMEDIQKDSGELVLVPKSHKFDIFKYSKFGCTKPKSLDEIKKNYNIYEDWVKDLIKRNGLEVKKIYPKKGETIIWDANLLHGGASINKNNQTRKSFVIHYTFKKVNLFYNPTFSFFKDDQDFNKRTHTFF